MTDYRDVIAAFVDNEPVDAGELAEALTSVDGREYLIDVLVLRGLVGGQIVAGARAPHRTAAAGVQSAGQTKRAARWLTAAAALIVASLTAGYFLGRGATSESPVVGTDTQVGAPAGTSAQPAPAPTHVIRLEKGVDWNERSGGN